MFLRKKPDEPEKKPAEEQESQDSNPSQADNPAAKTALLKAYFVQGKHSESEIENLVGDQVQPSGVEPLVQDDPAPQAVQEPSPVERNAPSPPPAPALVEGSSDERIAKLDDRITDLRQVLSGMAQQILDLQKQVEGSNDTSLTDQSAVSELQKKIEELSAKAELRNVTATTMRTDLSELQEKSEHTLADLEMRISKHLRDAIVELSSQVEKRVSEALDHVPPPPELRDGEHNSAPQFAEELARLREVTAQSTLNSEKRIRFLENKVNSFATLVPQLDKQVTALWEEASHTRSQINQQPEKNKHSAAEPSSELTEVREGLATMRMQTKQQLDDVTALANNSTDDLQDKVSRLDEQAARSVSQLRDEVTRLSNQIAAAPAQAAPAPGYGPEELAKLRDEWTEDMKRIVAKIGEVVTKDRNKIKHQIEETEKKLETFAQQPTPDKEVIERTATIQEEIQKLRNEVAASRKEVDNRVAGLKNTEEHSHADLENTRTLLAQGQEQFNSRVENVQNAVANLQGLLTRDKTSMAQTAEDLRKEVNLIRVELKDQGEETARKLDLFSKETEAGRQAIHNVSQVWDEITRLREEAVKARTQIEDRITALRSGGVDVHTEIESTRQIITESQNQFNARVESVQHTVEQLQRVIRIDKSDLTDVVDELKKEIDQARLDFGIRETGSLLHTSPEPASTEPGTPMLDDKEIEEAMRALSQLTDTP